MASLEQGLVGHWRLDGDCADSSGMNNHGTNHGVDLGAEAKFDGRSAYVEVPHTESLAFGTGSFAIAMWVSTERELDDVVGDIIGKFHPESRKGFNLNIKNHAGVTSSQTNYRNLHFGIDNAKIDPQWTDCGRPGNSRFIAAMTVHEGSLYVGTSEPGVEDAGHVYRYEGGTGWANCGNPDGSNTVMSLAVHDGAVYASTNCDSGKGSCLPESPNTTPGGGVYRYGGGTQWMPCGRLGGAPGAYALTVFRGELYGVQRGEPGLFKLEGEANWVYCGAPGESPPGAPIGALAPFHGALYSAGKASSGVWRYDGGADWTYCGRPAGENTTYGFAVYEGSLYCGTWEHAYVLRYEGGKEWTNCGRPGYSMEIMALAVYNGKLFAGALPMGEVYRFEPPDLWTRTGWLDRSDVKLRRVWQMAVYQGKLYAGCLPSGRVFSLEAGKSATYDHELQSGRKHIAAVRDGGELKLYVDGKLVAASSPFDPADYDISNDGPLRIGFGAHDYFNGSISDVRIYRRALNEGEVSALAEMK